MTNGGNSDFDPLELAKKLGESYRGIKLGKGVVGKTSYATLALLGLWAIVVIRLSENLWFDLALIGCGVLSTCIYIWWVRKTQKFATDNPALAMLEGAEFVEYQKWEAQIKGLPPLKSQPVKGPIESLPNKDKSGGE